MLHVVVRAHSGDRILTLDEDRRFVVERAAKIFAEAGVRCVAWAILGNHIHFVLICPGPPGRPLHRLNTALAQRIRRRLGDSGSVFQGRFFSDPCPDDASVLSRLVYVFGNPIHHREVQSVDALSSHAWSGLAELLGRRPARLLDVEASLALLAPDPDAARRVLMSHLEFKAAEWLGQDPPGELSGEDELQRHRSVAPAPAEESEATHAVAAANAELDAVEERRRMLRLRGWTPDRLLAPACRVAGVDPAVVLDGRRSAPAATARGIVAHIACDLAGWPVHSVAAVLGVGPTALVGARRRGRADAASLSIDLLRILDESLR